MLTAGACVAHQGGLPNPTSLFVRKTPYSRHAYDPIEKVELPVDPKREAYESKVRAALEKDAAKRERALEREKRGKKKKPKPKPSASSLKLGNTGWETI